MHTKRTFFGATNTSFVALPLPGHYLMYLSGHINVGTLLLGWRTGILLDKCRSKLGVRKSYYSCIGTAHVYHFGGRGSGTSWSGFLSSLWKLCGQASAMKRFETAQSKL